MLLIFLITTKTRPKVIAENNAKIKPIKLILRLDTLIIKTPRNDKRKKNNCDTLIVSFNIINEKNNAKKGERYLMETAIPKSK